MARLGLITLEDGILESRRQMMAFRTIRSIFHIPLGYGHLWRSMLALPILATPIPKLVVEDPWKDWSFNNEKSIFVVQTNDVYHKLVEDKAWLAKKVLDTWRINRRVNWWCRVLDAGWQSHLPFVQKYFFGI